MAHDVSSTRESDRAVVHHFIRIHGRAPTDEELVRFRARLEERARQAGPRLRAARWILRR